MVYYYAENTEEKCENEKANSEYTNSSVIFRLSLRCSLGCFCGGHYNGSQNTAFWSWSAGWGCILPQEPKGWLYITLLPIVYFFFWSQTTMLINGLTGLLFICSSLPGSLRSTLRAYFFLLEVEASLSLHFFSSEFISWYFSYTRNAISGFRWSITVITCGSSLPILWDMTSKCSKLLLPLPWELLPFQTVAINY